MEPDQDWLKGLVARRTQEMWKVHKHPYYISFIATDSAREGRDYKEVIAPLKLRQWALTADIEGARAVAHPVHKAKVGFVPADEPFEFDDSDADAAAVGSGSRRQPVNRTRRSTLQFLEALSTLSDDELDGVTIPVKTIVRLLQG